MIKTLVAAIAALGCMTAMPVIAHHNCNAGDACPEEIGDMMDQHEDAILSIPDMPDAGTNTREMDPVDDNGTGTAPGTATRADTNAGGM